MWGTSVRLPDIFLDAKRMIEDTLKSSEKLSLKKYGSMFSNLADVVHFHIEEIEDEESYANLDLIITYKLRVISPNNQFKTIEKTRNLKVLNPKGDNRWTFRMINKIWDGDYPSSVAVDMETGEVFLFSIKANRIELTEFGKFNELEFETFLHELNDREPFRIRIDEDAMFDYIDGAEGINHLQKNIYIEFNCGMPIRVYNKRVGVL